jgi:hypothetical protein
LSACADACVCCHACAQTLWRALYLQRWGPAAAALPAPPPPPPYALPAAAAVVAPPGAPMRPPAGCGGGGAVALCWRAAYGTRAAALGALRCPCCLSARSLTAVVYGFPSGALVAAQRNGRVLLGGDYLVDNDPAWACAACGLQWRAWPWAAGGPPEACPPAARVAGAGAGAGVHFAGEV